LVFEMILLAVFASFAALQALLVVLFVRRLRRRRYSAAVDVEIPTTVVLCVRGCDPSLESCIQGLADQAYRNWRLLIVADHPDDPALSWIQTRLPNELKLRTRFHVASEKDRLDTCSLKCNSLISACKVLDPQDEMVAFLDADTCPPQHWLKKLAAPFCDEKVGAVTGLRWYQPEDMSWGSWVRYVWNAAAIVQMWFYGIPWGGSLAIRRRFLDEAQLLNIWQTTFCEDTPLPRALKHFGYRLEFATDLIVPNHESCKWQGLSRWVGRQLLTTRLHHASWGNVMGHAALTVLLMVGGLIGLVVNWGQGDWVGASWILGGIVLYQTVMVGLICQIARAVETQWGQEGRSGKTVSKGMWGLLVAISLSQMTYARGAWIAFRSTTVAWRGITYQIGPRRSIRRLNYQPMHELEGRVAEQSID
jgi:hypothetical protein